jgi:hypothetical protein
MTLLAITGLAVTLVGLALVILGAVLAIGDSTRAKVPTKGGLSDTLEALAKLADALAKHPVGVRLVSSELCWLSSGA